MIRNFHRRLMAAALGAASLFSPAKQAAVAAGTMPVTASKDLSSAAVAQAPKDIQVQMVRLGGLGGKNAWQARSSVWNGVAKRGNRRGRSHWDYNR